MLQIPTAIALISDYIQENIIFKMLLCNYISYGNVAFVHDICLRVERIGCEWVPGQGGEEKSFLNLIIVWKI